MPGRVVKPKVAGSRHASYRALSRCLFPLITLHLFPATISAGTAVEAGGPTPSGPTGAAAVVHEEAPQYLEIVALYRRREYEEALTYLRATPPQRTLNMLGTWEDRALSRRDERHIKDMSFRPADDQLQAAAVMHTDFAMRVAEELKFNLASVHLDIAEHLIERIRNRGQREGFLRDWLLAVGYFYQGSVFTLGVLGGFDIAAQYYDEAVKRFPKDAEVLLSAGTLYEWAGSLKYGTRNI